MDDHLPQEGNSDEQDVRKRINFKVNSIIHNLNEDKFSRKDSLTVARLLTQQLIDNSVNPP